MYVHKCTSLQHASHDVSHVIVMSHAQISQVTNMIESHHKYACRHELMFYIGKHSAIHTGKSSSPDFGCAPVFWREYRLRLPLPLNAYLP